MQLNNHPIIDCIKQLPTWNNKACETFGMTDAQHIFERTKLYITNSTARK